MRADGLSVVKIQSQLSDSRCQHQRNQAGRDKDKQNSGHSDQLIYSSTEKTSAGLLVYNIRQLK
ncbi:MAG: hypothetical protein D3922_12160 [Candidatus Electrothrix sp. AR1]|nr:hypothetical protein [Candidatus Electrothrix sp. AR1]